MAAVAAGVGYAILAAVAAKVLGVDSDFAFWCVVACVFVAVFGWRAIRVRLVIDEASVVVHNGWRTYRVDKRADASIEPVDFWRSFAVVAYAFSPVAIRPANGRRIVIEASIHQGARTIAVLNEMREDVGLPPWPYGRPLVEPKREGVGPSDAD